MDELRDTFGLVLGIIALSLLAGGGIWLGISLEFEAHSNLTTGRVVEMVAVDRVRSGRHQTTYGEQIEFADEHGVTHRFLGADRSTEGFQTVGRSTSVRYRRGRPDDAAEAASSHDSIAGVFLLVLGAAFGVLALRLRRKPTT